MHVERCAIQDSYRTLHGKPEGAATAGGQRSKVLLGIQNVPVFLRLAIHFFSVSDLDDQDDQFIIVNCVDDPVVSFADTVEVVFTGQFLHPLRTRIVLQCSHVFDEALLDRWGEGSKLAFSRRGEEN